MKLAFAKHGNISGASAQGSMRHFSKLGAALLASALTLPFGCAKKEPQVEVPPPLTYSTVQIVRLSAPLDTLIRRMETMKETEYKGRKLERYRQWVDPDTGYLQCSESRGDYFSTEYHHIKKAKSYCISLKPSKRYKPRHLFLDDPGVTEIIDLSAFAERYDFTVKAVFSRDSSGIALACLVHRGLGTPTSMEVRGPPPYYEVDYWPISPVAKTGEFNRVLSAELHQSVKAVKWVLDYDTINSCAQLAAIALPLGDVPASPAEGAAAVPYEILGKYKGGYIATGWIFNYDNPILAKRWGDAPILFLLEPGVALPDDLRMRTSESHYGINDLLREGVSDGERISFYRSPYDYSGYSTYEIYNHNKQFDRDYSARMQRQEREDDDRAHGRGPRW